MFPNLHIRGESKKYSILIFHDITKVFLSGQKLFLSCQNCDGRVFVRLKVLEWHISYFKQSWKKYCKILIFHMILLKRHKKPRGMTDLHAKAVAQKTPALQYFISIMILGER